MAIRIYMFFFSFLALVNNEGGTTDIVYNGRGLLRTPIERTRQTTNI